MTSPTPLPADFQPGRPVLLTGGTVLTMDDAGVIENGDVLVVGERIAEVGQRVAAPDDAVRVDATGGIVMPGMVDTHRHMWQTALRGFGADWTLSQYFVFYYLNWGTIFRPEDVHAGNALSGIEALHAGVTTTVDWSHGLRTPDHADAAVDALRSVPGRFVLAYGNLFGAPWEWTGTPEFRDFVNRRFGPRDDMLGLAVAFDVTGDPEFPERAAFEVARDLDLPVTTHAGVWGATNDDSVRLMWDNGFMTPSVSYVHSTTLTEDSYQRIAASGGHASVSTESEFNAGQGYPPTWRLRRHGIDVSLSMDTSVWFSGDMFAAMRATLSADRAREHLESHGRGETVTENHLRAEEVVAWATVGGAKALGLDSTIGTVTPGKKADLVLIKDDRSPAMYPITHPYGHVVFQAGRGEVHTVLVDGRVVKYAHELIGLDLAGAAAGAAATVDYARSTLGAEEWARSMAPPTPEAERVHNPYTYTDYQGAGVAVRRED